VPRSRNLASRARRLGLVLAFVAAGASFVPSGASANYNGITDFHMYSTVTTYSGGPFTHSSCLSCEWYMWLDDPDHSTRMSINWCSDYSLFDAVDISAHDTSARYFTNDVGWFDGDCIRLRGRTLSGSFTNHDGTLNI
jgi:hypothetical protein